MEIKVNKKEMVDALKQVEIKGKWATTSGLSSKSLGKYIHFELREQQLFLVNSDESTTAVIHVDVETEDEDSSFVLDIENLKKYMVKMSDEITFEVNDTVVMKSAGKRATMPIVVEHPFDGRIRRFLNQYPITWESELETIPTVGVIDFNAGIQVSAEELYNAIDACEIVNNGIYKLNFMSSDDITRPQFIISSEEIISSYREELPFNRVVGESATVLFSGPLHKFFGKKGTINIFIGDDQPIIMVTENSAIVRAPRIGI
tara:strand:- start:1289 stop:2068 length:780 start_codon:yes stop_codon:yes gene_type:complete